MTETRKPQFETRAERIADGVASGRLREVPGLIEALEARTRALHEIDESPYVPAEKVLRRQAVDVMLRPVAQKAIDTAIAAAVKTLDQEEGQLRARAKGIDIPRPDHPSASELLREQRADAKRLLAETRARRFADQATNAATIEMVVAAFREAELTEDELVIRSCGAAARLRLAALAADTRDQPTAPEQVARGTFEQAFSAWERTHPTMVERLVQIERERGNVRVLIEASATHMLEVYGVTRAPAPLKLVPVPEAEPVRSAPQEAPTLQRLQA